MLSLLLSGAASVEEATYTRAQLPLLLNQLVVTTSGTVSLATETDSAFDATVFIGSALIPAEVAVETDTARDLTVVNPPGVYYLSVTRAEETDTALTATVYAPTNAFIAVDVAVETDTAFDGTVTITRLFPASPRYGLLLVPARGVDKELTPVTPT